MTTLKTFAAALMASTLLAAPALAQGNPPTSPSMSAPKPMAESPAAVRTSQQSDQWRASKLVGLNVYNANNEKIGDINELIMGKDGQIDVVVIGAGGFLGMGEHNVGLKWNQVKFVHEPVKSAATTSSTTTRPATVGAGGTTTSGATTTTTTRNTVRDYPDHAMVSMTKDQLKALPAFKYASDTSDKR